MRMKLFLLSMTGLLGLALFAACGDDPTPTPTPTVAAQATATPTARVQATATPTQVPTAKIDRVIIAIAPPGEWASVPWEMSPSHMWIWHPMYQWLVGLDVNTGEFIPELATEWSLEPDGFSWRFTLRQGVMFHDGSEFDASDVVFSWERYTQEDVVSSTARSMRNVRTVEVINDYEVIFRMDRPNIDIFELLTEMRWGMEMMSKDDFDSRGPDGVGPNDPPLAGTGPFMHKEAIKDVHYIYERFDDYWDQDSLPNYTEFQYRFITEDSTRLASLLAGEVHATTLPTDLEPVGIAAGMKVLINTVPALRTWLNIYCCYNPKSSDLEAGKVYPVYPDSPLHDVRVRKALNKAVDRDAINEAFFGGNGIHQVQPHINPTRVAAIMPALTARWDDAYGYDPDAARQILADAGYGPDNPLQTNIHLKVDPRVPSSLAVVEAIGAMWRAVGVEVNLMTIDEGTRRSTERALGWGNHFWLASSPATEIINMNVYHTSIFGLYLGWQHPTTQEIIGTLMSTLDLEEQNPMIAEVATFLYDEYATIPLFWLPNNVTVNPEFIEDWVYTGIKGPVDFVWNIKVVEE